MIARLKLFLKTSKGQLTAALAAFALSQLLLGVYFFGDLLFSPPTASRMTMLRSELQRSMQSLEAAQKEVDAYEDLRARCREMAEAAWQEKRHGAVETQLRQMIAAQAAKMDFTLNNIGAVRTGRINTEFYYADLDVSGSGSLEEVTKLLLSLQQLAPRPAWRRLDLRPDRNPNRPGSSGGTNLAGRTDPAVNATRLNFNGTLRMIGYDGKAFPPLKEKKK